MSVTDEEFWALVGELGGVADERSVARLRDRLGDRAEEFQLRVDAAVRELDGGRFEKLPVRDVCDPAGAEPLPLLGDALHSFLLAVVAAGPEVYHAVRADPAVATARSWSSGEAEHLGRVHEEISGSDGWCRPLVFGGGGDWQPYADAVHDIAEELDRREDWRAWWATAGREWLEVIIELTDEDTGTVRRGGRAVRADFRLPMQRLRHRSPGVAARVAAEDLTRILTLVGERLKLADPPPVPWPANAEPLDPRSAERAARLEELRGRHRQGGVVPPAGPNAHTVRAGQ
ncbi:hypothetical protein [Micromonospora sp. KC213]|uniref:hypothetical protein n=1 Tax=Micromonospora sp. KC213 TaxID=2530378 RepID=UPI00104B523F|nr:hypothetical protein [Micromonospora sp. KC213]TDC29213.1 hypothetical protein E1166_30115 [Micromonospora sp. KC213]